jgi:predicted ATPase/DNA-binding CsgD family transcriptional regulator
MATRTNLPSDLTSLVGRRSEMAQVRELLSRGRLITLTGLGGIGKTRLALQVARDVHRAFDDGAFFVDLAGVSDPALVPHILINTLEVAEQSARPPMIVLADHLRDRQVLLVLDSCEHLSEAVAAVIDTLLRSAPGVRILATSQQPLLVVGEHVKPVSPLEVPGADRTPMAPAMQYPAVQLFAERASSVSPGFSVNPDNEHAVVQICRQLEGIPLAIELAAGRLGVLTVHELADRIGARFEVLTKGPRTAPARQQTLAATLDWTFELCTPLERLLWERISVFARFLTLEAAEAVCTDEALPVAAILDTVDGLAAKSILLREEHDHRTRFRVLEVIRQYGQKRLAESGDEEELRRRHRDWYMGLVERAAWDWFGPTQKEWAAREHLEHANLRAALEFCLARPAEVRDALHMAGLSWFRWLSLGYATEGRLWLERSLKLDTRPSVERARALCTYALIAIMQGDHTVDPVIGEAESLARALNNDEISGYLMHVLGVHATFNDEPQRAVEYFLTGLKHYAQAKVPADYPISIQLTLSLAYLLQGELDKAFDVWKDIRSRCEQRAELFYRAWAEWGIGFWHLTRGETDDADLCLRQALRISREFPDTVALAFILEVLAWTAVESGAGERGAELLGGASGFWRDLGGVQLVGSKELMRRRERFEHRARELIGDEPFDEAFARGGERSMDEVVAFALGEAEVAVLERPSPLKIGLTRREIEVAELVCEGMSNKQIAARLVISRRTADAHVEHIRTKLGVHTRAQIAAWVTSNQQGAAELHS